MLLFLLGWWSNFVVAYPITPFIEDNKVLSIFLYSVIVAGIWKSNFTGTVLKLSTIFSFSTLTPTLPSVTDILSLENENFSSIGSEFSLSSF